MDVNSNAEFEGATAIFALRPILVILPTVNFTCEGTITGWTFAGTEHDGDISNVIFPTFQVWRQVGSTFNLTGSSNITATSVSYTFPSGAMIYTLTVEPIAVQPGDIFGMLLLPFTTSTSNNRTICPNFLDAVRAPFSYFRKFLSFTDVSLGVTSIKQLSARDLENSMVQGSFAFLISTMLSKLNINFIHMMHYAFLCRSLHRAYLQYSTTTYYNSYVVSSA